MDVSKPSTSRGEPSSVDSAIAVIVRVKPLIDGTSPATNFTYDDRDHVIKIKKGDVENTYSFSHVLKEQCTQEETYKKCVGSKLQHLLEGKSSFIFSYGASNSGKTFTIHGEKDHPGLIPRLLVSLFSLIENMDSSSRWIPKATSIMEISETDMSNSLADKKKLFDIINKKMRTIKKTESFIPYNVYEELKKEMGALNVSTDKDVYSIWLSFYEIYNEEVYDMFDETKAKKTICGKDPQFYIKDLNYIQVTNLFEAYLLYTYGRYRLSIFSTGVNCRSSRSHSVFTMKIIGRPKDCDMEYFLHSSMSICDLAGTERSNKTGNIGQRLKESNQINTSFLVLNKCLRVIRENQMSEVKKVIPYRESKLTQILGPSLTSPDVNLTMIVTLSQNDLNETEGILRSSSVATTIIKTISPQRKALPGQQNLAEDSNRLRELLLEETQKRKEAEQKLTLNEQIQRKQLENAKEKTKKIADAIKKATKDPRLLMLLDQLEGLNIQDQPFSQPSTSAASAPQAPGTSGSTAGKFSQPSTSAASAPQAPGTSGSTAGKFSQPSTSAASAPQAPGTSGSTAGKFSQPSTSAASAPQAPGTSGSTAGKVRSSVGRVFKRKVSSPKAGTSSAGLGIGAVKKRKRRLSGDGALKEAFMKNRYPDVSTRRNLASQLGITTEQVNKWFNNRRHRFKEENQEVKEQEQEQRDGAASS